MCDTPNPFKVGDSVTVRTVTNLLKHHYDSAEMYTVLYISPYYKDFVFLEGKLFAIHYTLLEYYKEPATKEQEKQPMKTKRIPFSEEAYNKYKDVAKVIWTPSNAEILYFSKWYNQSAVFIGVYKAPYEEYTATTFSVEDTASMSMEIPVTTKRIPFDASRKDAKVLLAHTTTSTRTELVEWVQMEKSIVVAGVTEDKLDRSGFYTALYHPNDLVMEIEE